MSWFKKSSDRTAGDLGGRAYSAAELNGVFAAISKAQAMIEFTLDGKIIHANANFLAALGYELS